VFVGNSKRKLDDKGRIVLSASLRDELDGLGYIAVADGCLAIWTDAGYRDFTDDLRRRVREAGELPNVVLRKLAADTERIRADSQGRVTLPAPLLDKAGIGSGPGTEVVVNGAIDRIEIWGPSTWDALSSEGNDALEDAIRQGGL
jgi:MraZ protein